MSLDHAIYRPIPESCADLGSGSIGRLGEFEQTITLTDAGYELEAQENKQWFDDVQQIHKVLAGNDESLSVNSILSRVEMRKDRLIELLGWGLKKKRWQMKKGKRNAQFYSVTGGNDEME